MDEQEAQGEQTKPDAKNPFAETGVAAPESVDTEALMADLLRLLEENEGSLKAADSEANNLSGQMSQLRDYVSTKRKELEEIKATLQETKELLIKFEAKIGILSSLKEGLTRRETDLEITRINAELTRFDDLINQHNKSLH